MRATCWPNRELPHPKHGPTVWATKCVVVGQYMFNVERYTNQPTRRFHQKACNRHQTTDNSPLQGYDASPYGLGVRRLQAATAVIIVVAPGQLVQLVELVSASGSRNCMAGCARLQLRGATHASQYRVHLRIWLARVLVGMRYSSDEWLCALMRTPHWATMTRTLRLVCQPSSIHRRLCVHAAFTIFRSTFRLWLVRQRQHGRERVTLTHGETMLWFLLGNLASSQTPLGQSQDMITQHWTV